MFQIQSVFVLGEDEALSVNCIQSFEDEFMQPNKTRTKIRRNAGENFYVYGPREYIPPLQVIVEGKFKALLQIESLGKQKFVHTL